MGATSKKEGTGAGVIELTTIVALYGINADAKMGSHMRKK